MAFISQLHYEGSDLIPLQQTASMTDCNVENLLDDYRGQSQYGK